MNESDNRPTIWQAVKYLQLRLLGVLIIAVPHWAMRAIAWLLGFIAFDVVRINRWMVLTYLAQVFPEKTPLERRRIGRAGHYNLSMVIVELLRARLYSSKRMIARVKLDEESEALYHEIMEEGRGVVFVGAHFSNWELLGARMAAVGYPLTAVFQDHPNPLINRYLAQTRKKLGINPVRRSDSIREIMKTLKDGGAIALIVDQDAGPSGGVVHNFFGKPVSSFRGPFMLAVRCNAPLVAGWVYREKGIYRAGFHRLDERVLTELGTDADEEERIQCLAASFVQWLEKLIRKDPRQYLWLHPRWQLER